MLQRYISKYLSAKLYNKQNNLLFNLTFQTHSCKQCGFRSYCSQKVRTLRNTERSLLYGKDKFFVKLRYSTQVDAQNKNGSIETLKDKAEITTSKKINVKLKPSELKRLLTLAEPEKWTLAGKLNYSNR